MGTKALHFDGQTKILRTADNKAANECAPTDCIEGLDTCCCEKQIDLTPSGITDCGLDAFDCEQFNGNTYTLSYISSQSAGEPPIIYNCIWQLVTGGATFQASLFHYGGNLFHWKAFIRKTPLPVCWEGYNEFTDSTPCDELPLILSPNEWHDDAEDCYAGQIEGYDGTITLDWT
jgi:hypothetical protein